MATGRIITAGDASLGEPEQDANSALTELDKGITIKASLLFSFIASLFCLKVFGQEMLVNSARQSSDSPDYLKNIRSLY